MVAGRRSTRLGRHCRGTSRTLQCTRTMSPCARERQTCTDRCFSFLFFLFSVPSRPCDWTPPTLWHVDWLGTGSYPRQLLAGAEDGEIGLLDVDELFSAAPDSDSLASSIGYDGGVGSTSKRGGTTTTGVAAGVAGEEKRIPIPRLCRGHPPKEAAPETPAAGRTVTGAAAAAGAALETSSLDGERVVSRGFAKAMDAFEDSLRDAADAELGSTGTGAGSKSHQQKHAKKGGAVHVAVAKSTSSASESARSGTTAKAKPLYRPVARGLVVCETQPSAFHGGVGVARSTRRRVSLSCLAVCARKPLLAAIARGAAGSPFAGGICDDNKRYGDGTIDNDASLGERQPPPTAARSTGGAVEIQIWNYRTKRALVRHRFGSDSSSPGGGGGGGDELVGSVIDAGGNEQGMGTNGGGGSDDGDAAYPVAVSLHPSGDSIAVAFPNYVNVLYIVGGGGGIGGDQSGSGGAGVADVAASKDTLTMSLKQLGVAEELAATETAPLATLRSDQREFLTKGMFSVSGEQEPIINTDPVSAVHYSPGGHLLAVVTGKVGIRQRRCDS